MYRVIKFFTDLQDGGHPYNPGDVYPRIGRDATPERVEELSTNRNKQHTPLIEPIEPESANDGPKNSEDEAQRRARKKKG